MSAQFARKKITMNQEKVIRYLVAIASTSTAWSHGLKELILAPLAGLIFDFLIFLILCTFNKLFIILSL